MCIYFQWVWKSCIAIYLVLVTVKWHNGVNGQNVHQNVDQASKKDLATSSSSTQPEAGNVQVQTARRLKLDSVTPSALSTYGRPTSGACVTAAVGRVGTGPRGEWSTVWLLMSMGTPLESLQKTTVLGRSNLTVSSSVGWRVSGSAWCQTGLSGQNVQG